MNTIGSTEVQYIRRNHAQQKTGIQHKTGILQIPKTGPIQDFRKCGYIFFQATSANAQQKKTNYAEHAKR